MAVAERWKAAKQSAFAYAAVDAVLSRQRAAAAAQVEAEAMRRLAEENAAAEASALEAAAAAERLRIDQEIASARERRLVQVCVTTPKLQRKSGVNLRL
jgi:hypothetical protein